MVSATAVAAVMGRLGPFEEKPCVAVAVSGGSDSMALALLLNDWAESQGGRCIALTVDHGLRPEAAFEAIRVHDWLNARGIEHHILRNETPIGTRSIQEHARGVRYDLLLNWCRDHGCLHLALAHQQDDQAETVMLRLARGSGVYGLAAMDEVSYRPQARLLRPLLGFSRRDLRDWLQRQGQDWIDDPSNINLAYARVQWRQALPLLAGLGLSTARLAETARTLRRAGIALQQQISSLQARSVFLHPWGWAICQRHELLQAPQEIALKALSGVLTTIGGQIYSPRSERLERLYDALLSKQNVTKSLHGCVIAATGGRIVIAREARQIHSITLDLGKEISVWDGRFLVRVNPQRLAAWQDQGRDRLYLGAIRNPLPCLKDGLFRPHLEAGKEKTVWKEVPGIARYSLPALYEGKHLIAIPSLGWYSADVPEPWFLLKDLRFLPWRAMGSVGLGLAPRQSRAI